MAKSFPAASLALSLAMACLAQPSPSQEKRATISGQVLNALTGEPVRKAELRLMKTDRAVAMGTGGQMPGMQSAVTDAAGKFTIADVEPGTYRLVAQKTGFVTMAAVARRETSGTAMLKVSAGQEIKDVQFKLMPGAVIAGKVTDEDGEPVQGVSVQALVPSYMRGRRQMMPRGMAQSNDIGEFRVANLPAGKYVLSVQMTRPSFSRPPADGSPETGYAQTYYPGVTDASQAARIEAGPGAQLAGYDVRLLKTRVFRVSGKVFDPSGAPLRNAMVTVMPRSGFASMMFGGGGSRPDGSFELANVAAGSYNLVVRAPSDGGPGSFQQFPLDVADKNIEGLELRIGPGQNITGKVAVEDNGEIALQAMRVMLNSADGSVTFNTPNAQVQADGTFTLQNVSNARYRVAVYGTPENTYVASIVAGGQDVLAGDLDCTSGAAPNLLVTLSTAGAQITGSVSEKEGPAAGAMVVLVPEEAKRSQSTLYKMANSDQTGAFTMKGVAPGDYKLFAFDSVEYGAWEDPDFLKQYEDRGETVKVQKKSTATVRVNLIPAAAK